MAGIVSASAAASAAGPASAAGELAVPPAVQAALTAYCVNCHGVSGKGNVRLVGLDSFKLNEWLDTLNKVQDQLFYKMMPPPSADQPGEKELQTLSDWVRAELRRHGASKLDDRLPYPDSGNYVDHATLFDGSVRSKPFTPARRWLVSPQIFEQRVLDVFGLEGQERQQLKRNVLPWVTNPFVLPDHPGVRYYDLHSLDGGHLLVMLANAEWIATKQLHAARLKAGQVITQTSENPRDKWFPKTTPAAFETIVAKKAPPTDGEIRAAIQTQFHSVLKRPPTDSELAYYLPFARDAIALGGNTEGLRQVLKAVLLESEFVYRLEFGAGQPDEYGRLLLAPREAAYAIGYALGDRGPDAALLQAAATGRLATRDDFRREVLRLLKDPTHYAGVVDDSLGGGLTTLATHPVLVRFFREFFGYATAHKVFKDVKRADGFYTNADRGSTGTAGALINEQGLSGKMCTTGHHTWCSSLGVFKANERVSSIKWATVDFELAKLFPSPLEHIELACFPLSGGNARGSLNGIATGFSARGPQLPNYAFGSPRVALQELFKSVSTDPAVQLQSRLSRSVMEFAALREARLADAVSGPERVKVKTYADSIDGLRQRDLKVDGMAGAIRPHVPKLDAKFLADELSTIDRQRGHVEVLLAALISGLTNVVAFTVDELGHEYTGLPGLENEKVNLHDVGHGKGVGKFSADEVRFLVRRQHMTLLDTIASRLKGVPDGNGTLFDNTMIFYFPDNGETHHSHGTEYPFILLCGSNAKVNLRGRYIRLPNYGQPGHKTLGNWYTTLLNAYGNPIKHYGEPDPGLARFGIDQTGAIKPFLA